jgi:cadherin EGF LAG seven-pass G-type receptor 1
MIFGCSIATRERNALLFYNGRYNDRHDFIAMEIVDGHVRFSFSLGTDVTTVSAWDTETGDVSDGQWHQIALHYVNRVKYLLIEYIGVICVL